MKKSDLQHEPKSDFDARMAFAPSHKFFKTEAEQITNMEKRIQFLQVLERRAKASLLFRLTDEFIKDFIERND
jgi:hypothetical protein